MGTYKYIDLDGYARISEHISAHNGTYLARNLARKIEVRFLSDSTAGSRSVRSSSTTGLLSVTASGTCVCTQVSTCHLLLQQPPASAPRPATRRASATASATPLLPASTQPAAWAPRTASAAQRPRAPPLPGRRVGAVIASTTGLESRRQARPAAGVTRRLLHTRNVSVSDKLCNSSLKG